MVDKPSDKAMGIAAQCWCDKETENKIMDVDLAVAFAKRLDNDYHAIAELTESNIKLRKENEKLNALQERYDGRDGIEWYRIKEVEYDKLIKERDQLRASLNQAAEALTEAIGELESYSIGRRDKSFDGWMKQWKEIEIKSDSDYEYYPNHIRKEVISYFNDKLKKILGEGK